MTNKHTPTPWALDMKRNISSWAVVCGKKVIANLRFSDDPTDRNLQLENAAFIVRACNAHDDLLAFASASLPSLEAVEWNPMYSQSHLLELCRKALSKARENKP